MLRGVLGKGVVDELAKVLAVFVEDEEDLVEVGADLAVHGGVPAVWQQKK